MTPSPDRACPPRCLCAAVRRVSRVLNRRYEDALRPAGMSTTQFELLMTLRFAGPNSQTRLARLVDTDQTTLSRNLKLLLAERWIETVEDKADARRRTYTVTRLGLAVLSEAQQLWHSAHDQMERALGVPMVDLWPVLDRILAVART